MLAAAEPSTQQLVTGARAPAFRRALGPTTWTVLEGLLTTAHETDDGTVAAQVSVRQLAADLGLACGTVARALVALRRDGLVTSAQCHRGDGAFAAGSYALHVPADVLALATHLPPTVPPARVRRVVPVRTEQLALLPE
jgi:hypothetical protein